MTTLWWTKNELKPSGANIGVKGGVRKKYFRVCLWFRQQSFEIESDAVDQPERVQ